MGGSRSPRLALALGALLMALAGCGGHDKGSGGASAASPSASKGSSTTSTSPASTSRTTTPAGGTSASHSSQNAGGSSRSSSGDNTSTDSAGSSSGGGSGSGGSDSGGSGSSGKKKSKSSGGSGGGGSGQSGGSSGSGGGGGSSGGAPKHVTVTIKDFKFFPEHVVVAKGGTIAWVNKETATNHTATKISGPSYAPDSPNIGWGGGYYEDFFHETGEITYICKYHRYMRGYITVK